MEQASERRSTSRVGKKWGEVGRGDRGRGERGERVHSCVVSFLSPRALLETLATPAGNRTHLEVVRKTKDINRHNIAVCIGVSNDPDICVRT